MGLAEDSPEPRSRGPRGWLAPRRAAAGLGRRMSKKAEVVDLAARRTRHATQVAEAAIERAVDDVIWAINNEPDAAAVIRGAARSLSDRGMSAVLFGSAAQMVINRP